MQGIFKTGMVDISIQVPVKAKCLKSTGLKPATVSVNGRNVSVSGEMVDTYWAKNRTWRYDTSLLLVEPTVTIKKPGLAFLEGIRNCQRKLAKSKN